MLSHRLAFAALAVACIAAAAGGSYVASRQNVAPPAAIASGHAAAETSSPSPVQETEALVGDTRLKAEADPASTAPAERVPRAEPPSRATLEHPLAPSNGRSPGPVKSPAKTVARNPEPLPTLEQTWPSGAAATVPPPSTPDPATAPSSAGRGERPDTSTRRTRRATGSSATARAAAENVRGSDRVG